MAVLFLWSDGDRRDRGIDLGCCRYLFFSSNGMEESNASIIVDSITKEWLGTIGGLLAVLGVIAAPITSGDTALRSARLIVADFMHLEQKV